MENFGSLSPFIVDFSKYFLPVVLGIICLLSIYRFLFKKEDGKYLSFRNFIFVAIGARVVNAGMLMYLQYVLWRGDGMASYFLNASLSKDLPIDGIRYFSWLFSNKLGYFLFYSWGRFWLSVVLSVFVAYIFYLFLKILRKKTERFFEEGEIELGLLAAVVVGWPSFVLFIPLIFIFVVCISIAKLFLKEKYTTLGIPIILSMLVLYICGEYLINLFNLGVLRI